MRGLVVVGLLGVVAGVAHARPGGGGHYSGGGGHSSSSSHSSYSSSGGGGSGGSATAGFVVLGALGVWGVAAAGSAVVKGKRSRKARAERSATIDEKLTLVLAHDPSFDRARFEARTITVMQRVNEAWCAEDMGAVRALVSDGVFVRFNTYLALLAAAGKRNVMSDWKPVAAHIIEVESDARWDTLHVQIIARARDVDLDRTLSPEAAAKTVRRAKLGGYGEVWSFVRRRGATSPADVVGGAVEGLCAKCGAPVPRSQTVRCTACGAVSNSGEHDWVLAEITQLIEAGHIGERNDVPGLPALRADDPDLSTEELEDRASMLFWKWIEARVTRSRVKLERFCATPEWPVAQPARLAEVAVGSCVTRKARRDDDHDLVDVDIKWSAFEREHHRHRVTLVRARGARSTRGLSYLDCPECGGELASSDDVTCRYCGVALRSDTTDWLLGNIVPLE